MRVFDFAARELGDALLESSIEIGTFFGRQLVLFREQHLDGYPLGKVDRFVEDDPAVLDMGLERLHPTRIASRRPPRGTAFCGR